MMRATLRELLRSLLAPALALVLVFATGLGVFAYFLQQNAPATQPEPGSTTPTETTETTAPAAPAVRSETPVHRRRPRGRRHTT